LTDLTGKHLITYTYLYQGDLFVMGVEP